MGCTVVGDVVGTVVGDLLGKTVEGFPVGATEGLSDEHKTAQHSVGQRSVAIVFLSPPTQHSLPKIIAIHTLTADGSVEGIGGSQVAPLTPPEVTVSKHTIVTNSIVVVDIRTLF